jgi:hypothetical protein
MPECVLDNKVQNAEPPKLESRDEDEDVYEDEDEAEGEYEEGDE